MTLTQQDIQNLKSIFATKEELFAFRDEFAEFKDMVMTNFDKLFRMFETQRDQNAVDVAIRKTYEHDVTLKKGTIYKVTLKTPY